MKIVEFPTNLSTPGENVSEMIDGLQKDVETIENLFVVTLNRDGSVGSGWANGSSPFTMVGAVHNTIEEFRVSHIEQREV